MTADAGAGPRAARPAPMTEAEFRKLYSQLRDQLPWGQDDRRGTLNNLRPENLLAALGEVSQGRTISMSVPIESRTAADNPQPAVHQMTGTAASASDNGLSFGMDRIAMNVHGNADSHMDALCHVIFDHALYNAVPADALSESGADELSIAVASDGVAGRGVLLDIPAVRGTSWLEPGDDVTVDDLLEAEQRQHVRFGRGDLLFIRVGHRLRRQKQGPWDAASARAGLHPTVVPLLAERQISVLGCDSNSDTASSAVDGVDFPVHVLAINAIGLPLIDYLQFEELRPACLQLDRWSFLCVVAPLRLARGTGSPVNPIAIV